MLSCLVLYYLFGVFGNPASHTLPVEESLTPYSGAACNVRDELDPLPLGEGVEEGVQLRSLDMLDVIVDLCCSSHSR